MKPWTRYFALTLSILARIGAAFVFLQWADRNKDMLLALPLPAGVAVCCAGMLALGWTLSLALVILHETGHLIAGALTGYRFLYFRVYSLMLIRQKGRLRLRRFSMPGMNGQCVMAPPAWTDRGVPTVPGNAGGLLMNLLAAVLLALSAARLPGGSLAGMVCRMALVIDVYALLVNGIPMGSNDGANLLALRRDRRLARAFWQSLTAVSREVDGMTLDEMPDELFEWPEDADLGNPGYATIAVTAAERLHARGDYDAERAAVKALLNRDGSRLLLPYHRFLLQNEALFLMCLEGCPAEDVTAARLGYGEAFRRCRSAASKQPGVIRTAYAEAVVTGDDGEAARQSALLRRVSNTYPFPRYVELARREMDMIDKNTPDKAEK